MTFYPQLGAGTMAQFPIKRTRKWRSITNVLESGERITLPDQPAGQTEWELKYVDLSDAEAKAIGDLFAASQGSFAPFTFVDPLANLLGWSEDLSQPDWTLGLLTTASGVADPLGSRRASGVTNGSAGAQAISQTLGISGDYVACFSAYVRSDAAGTVRMQRDGVQTAGVVGPQWKRMFVSAKGVAGSSQSTFSIELIAGQTIDVWGMQVEVQPSASTYRQTATAAGIYEETYFGNDELTITYTGVGLSAADVKLISRV